MSILCTAGSGQSFAESALSCKTLLRECVATKLCHVQHTRYFVDSVNSTVLPTERVSKRGLESKPEDERGAWRLSREKTKPKQKPKTEKIAVRCVCVYVCVFAAYHASSMTLLLDSK